MVYNGNWHAENTNELQNRILYMLNRIDNEVIQRLFEGTLRRLDNVRRYGLIETRDQ